MSTKNPATTSNRLLSHLSASDFALLGPHLTRVDLPLRKRLGVRGKLIDSIYFPESGFLSIVADGHGDRGIEVGLVGREGMTGLAVVMGANRAPHETFVQNAGAGLRIAAAGLRQAIEQSRTLINRSCSMDMHSPCKPPTRRWQTVAARSRSDWRAGC